MEVQDGRKTAAKINNIHTHLLTITNFAEVQVSIEQSNSTSPHTVSWIEIRFFSPVRLTIPTATPILEGTERQQNLMGLNS
jgi:hypothetical protein